MSPVRILYLILAVIGATLPMYYFVAWFMENGWSLAAMIDAWNVNDATTGLVYDLTIAAVALTVFVVSESISRRMWIGLVAVPATFCIGVSCGLPLYLFLRSRPLD